MSKPAALSYRADIDGLRAISVAVILLFHAGYSSFSGGFVGVDVFFVISGYLITAQILTRVDQDNFSFLQFYVRRVRRLMPAAMTTITLTAVFACFVLTPEELVDFGRSMLASLLWSANIFFWASTGYFDLDAHVKPLLHLWSLSVEEQFYLLWPAFLVIVGGRSANRRLAAIALISGASLWNCDFAKFLPSTLFYLMPFRIVEFGMGALLAVPGLGIRLPAILEEALTCVGLLLIGYSTAIFTETVPFPGLNALLPCLGATLTILGGRARFTGLLLRNPLSRGLGRISYSLYLVHWPIMVFYRIMYPGPISDEGKFGVVGLSIALGYLLFRYVEVPFRPGEENRGAVSAFRVLAVFGAALSCLSLAAVSMIVQDGWIWRYAPAIRDEMKVNLDKEIAWENLNGLQRPFGQGKASRVLVIGDSQAGDFLNTILAAKLDDRLQIRTAVVQAECQAVIPRTRDYYKSLRPPYDQRCREVHEMLLRSGQIEKADIVVIAANWQIFAVPELQNTIRYLRAHGVKEVHIVGRKDQGMSGQALLRKSGRLEGIETLSAEYRSAEAININKLVMEASEGAKYIDVMGAACPTSSYCRVVTSEGKVIFSDIMHFTRSGTGYMSKIYQEKGVFDFLRSARARD